ncbi:lipopolysaccharide biosynthesis protein [Mangrovimonas futianensis]|uniref:lipopolysaccharide biosynthesis protein n=1 Tax=Mangrovimonas futianensis TaxID=2895523 RepID=UPI001E549650|nr:polysaccharide biosynthesis C-terminal domain-containing protein [Mangrovimonas futianensis]MCF1420956.1 polysaccharide biosynthesis C-terminal domain-containing protein [Mangrovimonas futianensis]
MHKNVFLAELNTYYLGALKKFLKDTIIYGLATVLPRLMNFVLVPLHIDKLETTSYSDNTTFYIYAAFFNVLLTYGMETAFFRFFSKHHDKDKVFSTAFISLTVTTVLFFLVVFLNNDALANLVNLKLSYFNLLLGVLALDTLVVVPFAFLRATGRPIKFTAIKLTNIAIYVVLNFFFLWAIPKFGIGYPGYDSKDLVKYIFVANLAASVVTFILLTPYFIKTKIQFSMDILKQMLNYGWPVMVAGMAYVINENFDKWLLPELLGKDINGAYSGCYKIAVFMTIFIQGFRLGAEPFFFNHAENQNAKKTYADIMKYFVICGSLMMVFIMAYFDLFKQLVVRDSSYWIAIDIVPIVLLANLFLGIYFNLAIWYKLTDKTRFGMYLSLVGAFITIALNYYLIPRIGFMGSAWATLAAYGIMMVLSYVIGKRHYPVPYDLGKILLYLGLTVILSGIIYLRFKSNYLMSTVLLLVFLGVVIMVERKDLKRLLKN